MPTLRMTAGGGVLFKAEKEQVLVLMIFRRGVWDLPKGKMEAGESIEECASREVAEEVGCALPAVLGKLTETYHEYSESGKSIGKTTHWFAMKTPKETDFEPERREGIEKVKWFDLKEARQVAGYENLRQVLDAFENWLHFK